MQKTKRLTEPTAIIRETIGSAPYLEQAASARTRAEKVDLVSQLALLDSGIANESTTTPSSKSDYDYGYLTLEQMSKRLFARVNGFVDGQLELDRMEAHNKTASSRDKYKRGDKIPHLLKAIRFNHAVSEIFDAHSEITETNIEEFVLKTLIGNGYSQDKIAYARHQLRRVFWGMKHENAVEQALWELPELVDNIENPTEVQELNGIDRVVHLTNGSTVYIDVKASQATANKAMQMGHTNNIIVSPYQAEDFTDRRIKPDAVKRELATVKSALESISSQPSPHLVSV